MKKADEMEMSIQLRAVRWAWLYTSVFLAAWSLYDVIKWGVAGWPVFLLISQNLVQFFCVVFFRRRMGVSGKNHEEQD